MIQYLPSPGTKPRPHYRLQGALAAGAAIANATDVSEIVPIAGMSRVAIHAKTATAGGTLKAYFVAPVAADSTSLTLANGQLDPAKVTAYDDTAASNVTLTAGTSNTMTVTCNGERYLKVTITGGGTGTVTFVDIAGI